MALRVVERAASCKTIDLLYLGKKKHHSVITKLPQYNTVY